MDKIDVLADATTDSMMITKNLESALSYFKMGNHLFYVKHMERAKEAMNNVQTKFNESYEDAVR